MVPLRRKVPTGMGVLVVVAASIVVASLSASSDDTPTASRANSYDDGWQSNWIAHASSLLRTSESIKTPGFVLQIGDSITHSYAFAIWPGVGAGKTASDSAVTAWSRAASWGSSNFDVTNKNGWYLAAADTTFQRGMTSSGGLSLQEFVDGCCNGGPAMPASSDPVGARALLSDAAYSGNLQIDTVISAFNDAQFAVVMLGTNDPGSPQNLASLTAIVDKLEARQIVPILSTIPPRGDGSNELVVQFNLAVRNLASSRSLALIDYYEEIVLRRPGTSWLGTLISDDGVHPTGSGGGFSPDSDPYLPGGDPATHLTGEATANVGYLLRSWLVVQKLKEIKEAVIDSNNQPPLVTLTAPADGSAYAAPASVTMIAAASDNDGSIAKVEFYANGALVATDLTSPFEATINSVAAGNYSLSAKAFDNLGAMNVATSVGITVTAAPASTMHVGDLDATTTPVGKQNWRASVAVEIHTAAEATVAGATVSGQWSGGYSGTATCITTSAGSCTVSTGTVNVKKSHVVFTVNMVNHSTLTYQPGANHDVDNGSNGTGVTVPKP